MSRQVSFIIISFRFKKFCEYIKKRWVDKEARRFLARLETTALLKQGIRRKIGPMNKVSFLLRFVSHAC